MKCFQMVTNILVYRWLINRKWKLQNLFNRTMTNIIPCPCIEKLPCVPDVCDVGPISEQPKVLIIGAGVAGLSAAQRLFQCGVKNVIILEAAPRPGGRIYTCDCEHSPVDLGAQWIYGGCHSNMIFNLACQENLIKPPLEIFSPYRGVCLTSDGEVIKAHIRKKAVQHFHTIKLKAKELFKSGESSAHDNISLRQYLDRNIKSVLKKKFTEGERSLASKVMYGLTNDIKARMGGNLESIPVKKYGARTEIPGGDTAIKKGFSSILSPMINMIPKENIIFKKPIRTIKWKHPIYDDRRAEVYCCDGTVFQADFVILTVSLGVLKRHHEEMFCPCLPESKLEAINKLGFGNVAKIFLGYKRPFWLPTEGKFRLAWSENEIHKEDWLNSIGLIEEAPSHGKNLLVTVGGDEAFCVETVSSVKIVEKVTEIMRTFLSNQTIPYPKNILRSNWGHNAFTYGAVTYLGNESFLAHIKDLGSPIPLIKDSVAPVLLFAGEATSVGHYGTVQGARLSGIREAERILMITKRFGGKPKPDTFATCV
ncbi:peroxisomal N(1)-acetyl-spermine/spermidine oxidase-like [Rhodnius prolixus]|uniref:Amino_oxidase domain-containing protein n=1 Tax=Rhodnius prolixus TaxID=13249 RepID=T1ICX2_RHOPR